MMWTPETAARVRFVAEALILFSVFFLCGVHLP
jgi:hypothetical protein